MLYLCGNDISFRATIFYVFQVSQIPCISLVFFFLISSYIKKSRELSLESQISTIFVLFKTLILDCYTCVRACNLYCIVPKPTVTLLITRIRLYSAIQGAFTIITALLKRPENNFQLTRVIEIVIYFYYYIKIQRNVFNSITSL